MAEQGITETMQSTLMAEAYSLTFGLAAREWTFSALHMAHDKEFRLTNRASKLREIKVQTLMAEPDNEEIKMMAIMDAKSLHDNLVKEATNAGEKRAGIEVIIARESLDLMDGLPRWIPHQSNIVDCMTKVKGNKKPMLEFLETAKIKLSPEKEVMREREDYREKTGKANPRPRIQKLTGATRTRQHDHGRCGPDKHDDYVQGSLFRGLSEYNPHSPVRE